ncbi:hypothetical protein EAE96_005056 [Botrytis aclada]|nr:hypothetical protein EAE96_005056 [Botrytis aclada]
MPGALTNGLFLVLALVYACFISVVLLPIVLLFDAVQIRPGELIEAFLELQLIYQLRGNHNATLEREVGDRVPGKEDAPDGELPQARREWMVSRYEIMMGREHRIAQYRGFLHELQERRANRMANNARVAAPPEDDDGVGDDPPSDDEFDGDDDWEMNLP